VQALLEHDTLGEDEILSVTGLGPNSASKTETPSLVAP
jgi:hypothetical protein